jgi:hypothetical protein
MIPVNLTGGGNARLFWREAAVMSSDTSDKTALAYQPARLLIDAL